MLMLWQDAAFCMPAPGETDAVATSTHFYTPRAHIEKQDDGTWAVVFDDDRQFREDTLFYYLTILIGQYLKIGISEHTLQLDIQDVVRAIMDHVGAETAVKAQHDDPLLAGMRLALSHYDEDKRIFYLPLADRAGRITRAYRFFLDESGGEAPVFEVPLGDGSSVFVDLVANDVSGPDRDVVIDGRGAGRLADRTVRYELAIGDRGGLVFAFPEDLKPQPAAPRNTAHGPETMLVNEGELLVAALDEEERLVTEDLCSCSAFAARAVTSDGAHLYFLAHILPQAPSDTGPLSAAASVERQLACIGHVLLGYDLSEVEILFDGRERFRPAILHSMADMKRKLEERSVTVMFDESVSLWSRHPRRGDVTIERREVMCEHEYDESCGLHLFVNRAWEGEGSRSPEQPPILPPRAGEDAGARQKMLEGVAGFIVAQWNKKRAGGAPGKLCIGFEGLDASGKSTFVSSELAPYLRARGLPVEIVKGDWSIVPKSERDADPETYGVYRNWFDYTTRLVPLLEALRLRGNIVARLTGVYDSSRQARTDAKKLYVEDDTIVLVDGLFLQDDVVRPLLDAVVYFDITAKESYRRQYERDQRVMGRSPKEIDGLVRNVFLRGHREYMKAKRPHKRADLVVDNNDVAYPRLVRRGGVARGLLSLFLQ